MKETVNLHPAIYSRPLDDRMSLLPHDNKSTTTFLQSLERVEGNNTEVSFNTSFKENEI